MNIPIKITITITYISSNIWVTTIQLKELDGSDFCQVPCFPAWLASVRILSILSGSCFMDNKSAVMQTLSECSRLEQCWNDYWNESWGKVSKQKKSQYWLSTFITVAQWDELWGHLHSSWFLVHIVTFCPSYPCSLPACDVHNMAQGIPWYTGVEQVVYIGIMMGKHNFTNYPHHYTKPNQTLYQTRRFRIHLYRGGWRSG